MSKINGSALLVDINIAAPGVAADWKTICGATSHVLNLTRDLPDATTKCSGGDAEHIAGLKSWDVSVDGLEDPTNDLSFEDLYDLYVAGAEVRLRSYLSPAAAKYLYGIATISNLSENADVEQTVGWSATFTGNGGLTKSPT